MHASSSHHPLPPALSYTISMIAEEEPLWGLGIALMVLGTIASSIGMLCFKRASMLQATPWWQNMWFWSGLLLFVVTAAVLDTVVFAITPLALIAPFAGLTIIVSFALATFGCCGVNEPLTRTGCAAVLLIVTGVTMCAVFGPKSDGELTPQDLMVSFDDDPALFYLCVIAGPSFIVYYAWSQCYKDDGRKCSRTWMGAAMLALMAALCGALTQLQFKALASAVFEVISSWGNDDDADVSKLYNTTGEFVLQLFCVGSSGVAQIGYLNMAITGAPVAYTVPAYQSILLLSTLLLSAVVLNEFPSLPRPHLVTFACGAAVIVLGMLLNAWGLARTAKATKQGDGGSDTDATKTAPWGDDYPGAADAEASAAARKEAATAKYG